ncbi:MAG: prenyltransferase [Clostridia bacterium]|jgi:1,4-dihydroxy-2-naphthoate octaprenyltransferase|nr:prenyltransferase [Clostridia bacterium]MDH7573827.1 prenyltransferase [Clostridia bacterium]
MARGTTYVQLTRPQFLLLTPACVIVGVATALERVGPAGLNPWHLLLVLVGAVAAHAAVNVLNDYYDYLSGLDYRTRRTPFSGGTGLLPEGRIAPRPALLFGLITLAVTVAVGVFFLIERGAGLLGVGVPGVLLVVFYTQLITRNPWLCLLAPGLGFGPCMVLGTHFALAGSYDWRAVAASVVPGLLVSNLLLINQFPDVEADRTVGRYHFPIRLGRRRCACLYTGLALGTYVWIALGVSCHLFPPGALLGLVPLPLAWAVSRGVRRHADDLPHLIPLLSQNVVYTLVTPVLLAAGFLAA